MSRIAVIGLDGATFRLIDRYGSELDTLSGLMAGGYRSELLSTIPDITSVAWPAFATGMNPGRTGLFDFMSRDPSTMEFSLNDVRKRDFDFFWEYLDGPTGIASVPMIPYRSPEGFFIQGSLARINADRITNPPELEEEIDPAYDYHVDPSDPPAQITDGLTSRIAAREQLYSRLVGDFDLPCYFLMFSAIDFAQHHFWAHAHESHPLYRPSPHDEFLREVYHRVDDAVGTIIEALPPDTNVVVVSDHGFTDRHTTVNLNALLRAEGNLAFEDNTASRATDLLYSLKNAIKGTSLYEIVPDRLRGTVKQQLPSRTELDEIIDWQRTRAYSFGAGGNIYLNLEGRERDGLVPESEYEAVRATVASLLEALTDPETGDKVVGSVSYRESVYKGPYLHEAPDIVLRPATGYYLTSKHGTDVFERQTALMPNSGMHEREGVLLADGPDISAGAGGQNDIYDVAPTILHLQGKTVPESMDGSVIEELIEDDRPVTRGSVEKPEKRRIQSRVLALRQLDRI